MSLLGKVAGSLGNVMGGSIGGLAASALGAGLSFKSAADQRKWAEKQRAVAWQTTVRDMKLAGINPILAYKAGPTPISAGGMAQMPDFAGGMAAGANADTNRRQLRSQDRQRTAQIAAAGAQRARDIAQTQQLNTLTPLLAEREIANASQASAAARDANARARATELENTRRENIERIYDEYPVLNTVEAIGQAIGPAAGAIAPYMFGGGAGFLLGKGRAGAVRGGTKPPAPPRGNRQTRNPSDPRPSTHRQGQKSNAPRYQLGQPEERSYGYGYGEGGRWNQPKWQSFETKKPTREQRIKSWTNRERQRR